MPNPPVRRSIVAPSVLSIMSVAYKIFDHALDGYCQLNHNVRERMSDSAQSTAKCGAGHHCKSAASH
ncbi:hypothetical protein BFJ69_g10321 [Fusarium oxysporum]|uniref:Uncharacterized protein n=1 Tax=Fusarium oxysporum TaxID=5507 RepID=A0A420MVZ5_FUSOX|nr:hypothetical protein BFJ69_g10321 [Fusarium oxysporum]